MTIINFDKIIGKEFKCITNNIFCLNHPKNCLIVGKTNSEKSNILMNLIAQNTKKIHIFTNNLDDEYNWLKQKFKNDVHIYINEVNVSNIDKEYINLVVFEDLIFSDKKYQNFLQKVEN